MALSEATTKILAVALSVGAGGCKGGIEPPSVKLLGEVPNVGWATTLPVRALLVPTVAPNELSEATLRVCAAGDDVADRVPMELALVELSPTEIRLAGRLIDGVAKAALPGPEGFSRGLEAALSELGSTRDRYARAACVPWEYPGEGSPGRRELLFAIHSSTPLDRVDRGAPRRRTGRLGGACPRRCCARRRPAPERPAAIRRPHAARCLSGRCRAAASGLLGGGPLGSQRAWAGADPVRR